MNKTAYLYFAASVGLAPFVMPQDAAAVGGGLKFDVQEGNVLGTADNKFIADSLDYTYHACVEIGGANNNRMRETGYFWVSSYQDADSVVDSQINYVGNEGYHIYATYTYEAQRVGAVQGTPTGNRLNYIVNPNNANITLILDPKKNTKLGIRAGCKLDSAGTADDIKLGVSTTVAQGERSETDGLANGDFKLVFSDWIFTTEPQNPIIPMAGSAYRFLVFNGNITRLRGPLRDDHRPEGSGNLFWLEKFKRLPWNSGLNANIK